MYVIGIAHLHNYKMSMFQLLHETYIDKEIQPHGVYNHSTQCWPLLLGTGKAKVELVLDIQLKQG